MDTPASSTPARAEVEKAIALLDKIEAGLEPTNMIEQRMAVAAFLAEIEP